MLENEELDDRISRIENTNNDDAGIRVGPGQAQAGVGGGSPQAIADELRRTTCSSAEELGNYANRQAQTDVYRQIAERAGKLLPERFLDDAEPFGFGGEHDVVKKNDRVFKITKDHEGV